MPLLFYLPLIIWTGCSRSRMAKHDSCQSQDMTGDSTAKLLVRTLKTKIA
jgi:hypothetical protein